MKNVEKYIVLLMITITSTSCTSLFDAFNNFKVEPFGNVSFLESGIGACIDWLKVEDDLYYYVSQLDSNVKYGNAIGAFNDLENGYTLYSLEDDKYQGVVVLESKNALDTTKWVYVLETLDYIDCLLLYDIPHKDSWIDNRNNIKINEIEYTTYYSTKSSNINKGKEIATINNITYYSIDSYNDWICSVNKADNNLLDLYYSTSIEKLPVYFIKITHER